MSGYNPVDDPLCYPGTQVLRNKADIRDQDELDQFEQLMFESRAMERLPEGALDFAPEGYTAMQEKKAGREFNFRPS